MLRRKHLLILSAAHWAVDFLCFYRLAAFCRTAESPAETEAGVLLFALLSCGLQPFLGRILDERPKLPVQPAGALLLTAAMLLPERAVIPGILISACANALFLSGAGGESVIFSRGYFARSGIFFAAGAFGAGCGAAAGASGRIPVILTVLPALAAAVGCFFFGTAEQYPRKLRSFRNAFEQRFSPAGRLWVAAALMILAAGGAAEVAENLQTAPDLLLTGTAVCIGRLAGGFAADRFGPRKTVTTMLAIALPLMTVFVHVRPAYLLGTALLSAVFPVFLCMTVSALPAKPHFACGIARFCFFLGGVLYFFRPRSDFAARILCAAFLMGCLILSARRCTDNCRMFWGSRRIPGKKQSPGNTQERKEKPHAD